METAVAAKGTLNATASALVLTVTFEAFVAHEEVPAKFGIVNVFVVALKVKAPESTLAAILPVVASANIT